MEKEQGRPSLIHEDKMKAVIHGSIAEQQGTELSSQITAKTDITREH